MVANLALQPLHEALHALATEFDMVYSAWVDDLTFSGRDAHRVIERAVETIQGFGFAVSREKIHVMRSWREAQHVVGAVVNSAVTAGQDRIAKIERAITELALSPTITDGQLRSVRGQIAFVRHLRIPQGAQLERLADRLLPPYGVEGSAIPRVEWRHCRRARRHAVRRAG